MQTQRHRSHRHDAYLRLIEPYRSELRAHCRRMLGSHHDAEEVLQESLLRAWRALPSFEGRGSVRSWLYRIATNASLDAIARRPVHEPPIDPEDRFASPELRYERREGVEMALAAAVRLLPARQRAALVLRDVFGYSAKETAATLETTTASVTSALQRARETFERRPQEEVRQASPSVLGDEDLRRTVEAAADAWERGDVDAVVSVLA